MLIFVKLLSDCILGLRHFKIERPRISGCDNMGQVWVRVFEMCSSFSFPECQSCGHAIDDPRACLNDSALSLWELMVELVYRLAQFVLGFSIPAEVFFSYTSESVE